MAGVMALTATGGHYHAPARPTITLSGTIVSNTNIGVGFSSAAFSASGGTAPYQYGTSGNLPPGISIAGATGVLAGLPNTAGTYTFSVIAIDANNFTGSASFTLVISPLAHDPYFQYVTLLLNGEGATNGATNSTFLDSSASNYSLTTGGTPTQGTFGPYTDSWSTLIGYSTYGYLTAPANTAYDVLGSNFTVEYWANFTTWNTMASSGASVIGNMSSAYGWYLGFTGAVGSAFALTAWNGGASTVYSSTGIVAGTNVQLGTWNHYVCMQSGSTLYFFLNGVLTNSVAAPSTLSSAGGTLSIGVYLQNLSYAGNANVYVSNARIVKGTAVYSTSGFTPPTSPLTAIAGTTFLGCQESRHIDNSPLNATLTAVSSPVIQRFNPFGTYTISKNYSTYFNSSNSDYLTITNNSAFNLGTSDFTIELWVYLASLSVSGTIFSTFPASGTITGYTFAINTSGYLFLDTWVSGTEQTITATSNALSLNRWYHVAVTRASGTYWLFVNGSLCTFSGTVSQATNTGGNTIKIGYQGYTGYLYPMNGSISNLRIVNGTALYTAAFTPSTAPLTAVANTQLLTCQNSTFIDNSTNAFTLTPATTTVTPIAASPFTPTTSSFTAYSASQFGGSAYFNGTTPGAVSATNSAVYFGTNNFTVECWIYFTTNSAGYQPILMQSGTADYQGLVLYIETNNTLTVNVIGSGSTWTYRITTSIVPTINVWYHLAVVRVSSIVTFYANGISLGTVNIGSSSMNTTTGGNFNVGYYPYFPGGARTFTGYITNVRLVNGTAVYTSTFAPPTAPLTAITNTQLLLNFSNAGITDASMANDVLAYGTAQVSTGTVKYGSGALSFTNPTNGSYVYPTSNTQFAFGTGDFTIEVWLYPTSFSTTNGPAVIDFRPNATNGYYLCIGITTSGVPTLYVNSSTVMTAASSLSLNTWTHFALCRASGVTRMFLNGTQTGSSYTDTNSYAVGANRPVIAANGYETPASGVDSYIGFMDDIRITRFARYTANFTPPTSALLTQ